MTTKQYNEFIGISAMLLAGVDKKQHDKLKFHLALIGCDHRYPDGYTAMFSYAAGKGCHICNESWEYD